MTKTLRIEIVGDYKGQGFKEAKQDVSGLADVGGKLATLAGGALVAGLAAAGAAAAEFAAQSVASFQSFEKGMAEVFTLLPGQTGAFYDELQAQTRDAAAEMGRLPDDVVPALYQALSAGVPQDNVFEFLEVASDAARGGVTDLETAVDGITSVVNAYGEEVVDAATASDIMFTAVKLGKTNFEQLSSSLFNVIPTAASLGVTFEDVAANLAAMTAQGVPTSVATTQLRQAFVEASKSGTDLDKALRNITGQTFPELISSGMTSAEIFSTLRNSMPEQAFRDLFGSVEASNAALLITSETADGIIESFGGLEGALGATGEAAATMEGSLQNTEERLGAATERLKLLVGEGLAPAKQAWMEFRLELATSAADYLEAQQGIEKVDNASADLTTKFYEAASASGQLADGFSGTADSADGAEEALARINGTYGAYSDSVETAEARNRALQSALTLLEGGFTGSGAALAEAAIRMAEFGDAAASADTAMLNSAGISQSSADDIREAAAARAAASAGNADFADKVAQSNNALNEEETALARSTAEHRARMEELAAETQQQIALAEAVRGQVAIFREAAGLSDQLLAAQATGDVEDVLAAQEAIQESYRTTAFEAMLMGATTQEEFARAIEAGVAIGALTQSQADTQLAITGTRLAIEELNGMMAGGGMSVETYAAAFATLTSNVNASVEAAVALAQEQQGLVDTLVTEGSAGLGDFYRGLAGGTEGDEPAAITPEVDTTMATTALDELQMHIDTVVTAEYIAEMRADTDEAETRVVALSEAAQELAGEYRLRFVIEQSGTMPDGAVPGRAIGGPVAGGRAYWVGEQGPELFVPNTGGQIINAGQSAALAGQTVSINSPITINVDGGDPEEIAAAVQRRQLSLLRNAGVTT